MSGNMPAAGRRAYARRAVGLPAVAVTAVMLELAAFRLANGVTVIHAARSGPVTAIEAWVGAGAADEPVDRGGLAHAVEHMLFRSTRRLGAAGVASAIGGRGGDVGAWTSHDHTAVHAAIGRLDLDAACDAIGDALAFPRLSPDDLDRERDVLLAELRHAEVDPDRAALEALFRQLFVVHPYRRSIAGSARSIAGLASHALETMFRTWYVGGNTTLVIAGDHDGGEIRRAARGFAAMPAGARSRVRRVEPAATIGPRVASIGGSDDRARVAIGFRAPPLPELDVVAAALAGRLADLDVDRIDVRHVELLDASVVAAIAVAPTGRAAAAIPAITGAMSETRLDDDERARAVAAVVARRTAGDETAAGAARRIAGDAAAIDAGRLPIADIVDALLARARVDFSHSRAIITGSPSPPPSPRVAQASPPREPVRVELPNGTIVIVVADPGAPVVAMRALWPGGSRIEDDARAGATALLAAVLPRGCGHRDAAAMARAIGDAGGALDGSHGRNNVGLRAEWRPDAWSRGFDLVADCIVAPRLDDGEVERARRRQLAALTAVRGDPRHLAFRLFNQALYRRHPYRRDPLGTAETIAGLTRTRLAAFYRDHYPTSRLVLAVVGDVDPDAVIARARARFAAPSPPRVLQPRIDVERFDGRPAAEREVYAFVRDRDLAQVVIGFPGGVVGHADRHARDVLVELLGGHGGRLFRSIRDRLGLAYHVAVHAAPGVDPGYVAIEIACPPDRVDRVLAAVRAELDAIVGGDADAAEVGRARRAVIGAHLRVRERRAALAHALAYHEVHGLGIAEHARIATRVAAVTAVDVRAIAARTLRWDRAVIATVAPPALSPAARRRARTSR